MKQEDTATLVLITSYTTFAGEFPAWFSEDMRRKGAMVHEGAVRVPKLMKKHRVKMFLGSDMFGWDNWHNALVNVTVPVDLPDSPFTSLDAMKMATALPGRALRELTGVARDPFKGAKLGVVEDGAWADFLIWRGAAVRPGRVCEGRRQPHAEVGERRIRLPASAQGESPRVRIRLG